jgi:hypothetical protein
MQRHGRSGKCQKLLTIFMGRVGGINSYPVSHRLAFWARDLIQTNPIQHLEHEERREATCDCIRYL